KLNEIRILALQEKRHLWTFSVTAIAVLGFGVLYGVALGLSMSAWSLLRKFARLEIKQVDQKIELSGIATFLDLPKLLRFLEKIPATEELELCTNRVVYMDPSAKETIESWRRTNFSPATAP
ncbi:MAG: hypothetical protein EBU49_08110, partial [Proteobacteria bacterium]|nr:hypothetical protein [Pseudomonadota bacterium]